MHLCISLSWGTNFFETFLRRGIGFFKLLFTFAFVYFVAGWAQSCACVEVRGQLCRSELRVFRGAVGEYYFQVCGFRLHGTYLTLRSCDTVPV